MKITIDLDTVIFDPRPLFKRAFKEVGQTFRKYHDWDLSKCYDEVVCFELFGISYGKKKS